MANTDKPNGFKPVRHINGSPWNGQFRVYLIPASDGTDTFVGDAVKSAGAADSTGKYATVVQASASSAIRGVIVAMGTSPELLANPTDLSEAYRAGSTARYVGVVDDPSVVFEIQEDSDGNALAKSSVGLNAKITVGSGDTTTGASAMELDSDTAASSAGLGLRILGLVNREDNEIGSQARWEVLIENHEFRGGVAGV